jgi:hypothetical protein
MVCESSSLYDSERQALFDQLRDVSPRLAGLYRRLVRLLDENPSNDERLVRASLIGHCVRELINRLPDVLADVPDMLDPVKPKSSELVQRLPRLTESMRQSWRNFPERRLKLTDRRLNLSPCRGPSLRPCRVLRMLRRERQHVRLSVMPWLWRGPGLPAGQLMNGGALRGSSSWSLRIWTTT